MGFPAGIEIDMDAVQDMLNRRRPGGSDLVSQRNEADIPEIKSGFRDGNITDGEVIRVTFENKDVKNTDIDRDYIPRPGHGDFTYYKSTGEFLKGATSARSTVAVVFAGALCKQYLANHGVFVSSKRISPDDSVIRAAAANGDSVGGIVETTVLGLRSGFGNPFAEKLESSIASCVFNIPGLKGLEFGLGFGFAGMTGSQANDAFVPDSEGNVRTLTNKCGGVLGGMATGAALSFNVVFKPTPSIRKPQQSVNLKTLQPVTIISETRNDPCIAVRGAVVVEAATCIALCDIFIRDMFRPDYSRKTCSGCSFIGNAGEA